MTAKVPVVSVGMPVYNAERFVDHSITSILGQTCRDFELIIVDNCSTDSSHEICASYARKDKRIRLYQNARNIGAGPNHMLTLKLARAEYFKWQSADDKVAPNFLDKCIGVLQSNTEIVLCHSWTELMDASGTVTRRCERQLRTDSPRPGIRWREMTWYDHQCYQIYGLIRRSALEAVGGLGCYIHGDGVTLARLALRGRFHEIPESLFFSRKHPKQSMQTLPHYINEERLRLFNGVGPKPPIEWWNPARIGKPGLPEGRLLWEYLVSISRAPIKRIDQAECFASMLPWVVKHCPRFANDLIVAIDSLLNPILNWKRFSRQTARIATLQGGHYEGRHTSRRCGLSTVRGDSVEAETDG